MARLPGAFPKGHAQYLLHPRARRSGSLFLYSRPGDTSRSPQRPAGKGQVPSFFLLFSGLFPCSGRGCAGDAAVDPRKGDAWRGHPRPAPTPHLLSLPQVATGRPGHRRLAREGVFWVRARKWSTSGSSQHPRGWGPRSRPRAGMSQTQRPQLQVRTRRREPCQAGGALAGDSRSGTAASGGNEGAGSGSRAQRPLGARGAHPAVPCPPQGRDFTAGSPGSVRATAGVGGYGPLRW